MDTEAERIMLQELLEVLAVNFKWELNTKPTFDRMQADSDFEGRTQSGTEFQLIGGSNCMLLYAAIANQGVAVESLHSPGWVLCPKAIDGTIAHLGNVLPRLPVSVPIVIWGLDNACFRALSPEGDLSRIVKSKDDNKFHVPGDIAVTPYVLLKPAIRELQRLLAALKDREAWILGVLPRFMLVFCCEKLEHCAEIRLQGPEGTAAGRRLLEELAELNADLAAHLTGPGIKLISTGDLLTGVSYSTKGTLMDALYETWNLDPVHGEKIAYTKIGLALLKYIDKKRPVTCNQSTKRSREGPSTDETRQGRGRRSDRDIYERDLSTPSTSSTRDGRDSSRIGSFSDRVEPDRRRGRPPGRYSGRRRDSW